MNHEEIRAYCLTKKGVEEGFPFDDTTLVFKVLGKMFLLLDLNASPAEFNAKCEPDEAIKLREKYPAIRPGYHMNKTHWNTVTCDHTLGPALLRKLVDMSYDLVVSGLSKKLQNELKNA